MPGAFAGALAIAFAIELAGGALAHLVLPPATAPWAFALVDAVAVAVAVTVFLARMCLPALREADRDKAAIMEAVAGPLLMADAGGRILYANAAARTFFGTADGRVAAIDDGLPPATAREAALRLKEVRLGGGARQFRLEAEGRLLDVTAVPVLNDERVADRVALHIADNTDRSTRAGVEAAAAELEARLLGGEPVLPALDAACSRLLEVFGAKLAWLGRKEESGAVTALACSVAGGDAEDARRLVVRWDDTAPGRGPVGQALRSGEPVVAKSNEVSVQEWQKSARRFGLRALVCVPVQAGRDHVVLTLGGARPDAFDHPELLATTTWMAKRMALALRIATDRQWRRLMETGLSAAANGVFVTDRDSLIEWVNPAFLRMCGFGADEVLGRTPRLIKSGQHEPAYYEKLWQTILGGSVWEGEVVNRRKDGSLYIARQTITPWRDYRGEVAQFIAVQEDITVQRETEQRLHRMAQYDGLTDLPNRALFFDRLGQGIVVAKRNHHSLALMFVDIDNFKSINDSLGHRAGDLLLQAAASRLKQCVRESDTVARLAGDEFAVILPQVMVREDAARVAEKILDGFKKPFDIDGRELSAGVSIGIALYPHDGDDPETLISRADAAMMVVKMRSRNSYRFSSVV